VIQKLEIKERVHCAHYVKDKYELNIDESNWCDDDDDDVDEWRSSFNMARTST
jgi:hypothetical protein